MCVCCYRTLDLKLTSPLSGSQVTEVTYLLHWVVMSHRHLWVHSKKYPQLLWSEEDVSTHTHWLIEAGLINGLQSFNDANSWKPVNVLRVCVRVSKTPVRALRMLFVHLCYMVVYHSPAGCYSLWTMLSIHGDFAWLSRGPYVLPGLRTQILLYVVNQT